MKEGKVVMVTGASSGIGRELCLYLAKSGHRIVAAARRIDKLKSLCDEINSFALGATESNQNPDNRFLAAAVNLDVTGKELAVEESVKNAWNAFGRIDVLVNNAGFRGGVHSSLDWSEDEWGNNIRTNLTGLWLVSKHVCKRMRDGKIKGSVINISSIGGLNRPQPPGGVAYVASKTGVIGVTRVMAVELGKYDIRVNAIAPGLFKSEITEALMHKDWMNKVAKKIVPLRTYGTIDPAITSLVRYLIHDSSQYVSNNVFIVDAGMTLPGVPIFSSL